MLTIYKASAGSGKTFTLAAQYIANLLRSDNVSHKHILAVTFTNKATAEMKTRILQHLYAIAHGEDSQNSFFCKVKSLIGQPNLADDVLRQRAAKALAQILDNYDDFSVTTIDSFFQQLLSSLAHDLGLAASIAVDIGDNDVIKKAVNRLIAETSSDVQLADWVSELSRHNLSEGKTWQVATDLSKLAGELLEERYLSREKKNTDAVLTDQFVDNFCSKLEQKKSEALGELIEAATIFDNEVEKVGGYEVFKNGKISVVPFVNNLKKGLKHKSTNVVFRLAHDAEAWYFASPKSAREKSILVEVLLRPKLLDLTTKYLSVQKIVNTVTLSTAWIRQLRLMRRVESELKAINNEEGRFMLAYTPSLFHELLFDANAQFVLERAGVNFRHIMIDEFQDTSPMQWQNMRELLVGSLASGNDCLLVGDVKQGIYRFRGGDWTTLQNASAKFSDNVKTLQQNFRSGAVIVDFNNRLFRQAAACLDRNQQEQGLPATDLSEIYSDVCQKAPRGNYGNVRVNFIKSASTKEDAPEELSEVPNKSVSAFSREKDIYDTICDLRRRGVSCQDMVILVHKDKQVAPLADAFAAFGADFEIAGEKVFQLQTSPCIQILIAALRLLNNPADSISRHMLRSHIIRQTGESELPEKYERMMGGVYNRYPIMQIIMLVIEAFGLNDDVQQNGYLFGFLEMARTWADENPSSLPDFLRDWDETLCTQHVVPDTVEAIRAMTIHKSKGLDFKVVLIPYAEWKVFEIKNDYSRLTFLWCDTLKLQGGEITSRLPILPEESIPLLPVPFKTEMESSTYQQEYLAERHDQYIENLNLLYVACTRACTDLYIWAKTSKSDEENKIATVGDLMYEAIKFPCKGLPPVSCDENGHSHVEEFFEDCALDRYSWEESSTSAEIVETVSRDIPYDNPLVIDNVQAEEVPLLVSHRMPPVIMVAEQDEKTDA